MKKIVLTGGPGTGKSTLILALEQRGEYVIRESAEDVIRLMQAQGHPEPWTMPGFQELILKLQLQRESRIPDEAARVFMDRGVPDGLAYALPGTRTYELLLQEAKKAKYDLVFLVENLGCTNKTAVRAENHEEAVKLGSKLEEVYRMLGYEPIRIPAVPLNERLEKILSEMD